jgi:hypothetical protein
VSRKPSKSCRFSVGTSQGRNLTNFPVSRNGWKEAIAHAQQRSRDSHDVYDINFSCGADDPFGPRSLFLVTCASGFKAQEYTDPKDPRNPNVCTTVYAQRSVRDMPSPVLARRKRRRK